MIRDRNVICDGSMQCQSIDWLVTDFQLRGLQVAVSCGLSSRPSPLAFILIVPFASMWWAWRISSFANINVSADSFAV